MRSFCIEFEHKVPERTDDTRVGVDLGYTSLATIVSSTSPECLKVEAPKPLRRSFKKLKRLSRALSRKKIGSSNRAKAETKLARLHRRIADIRLDALHKLTTKLVEHRTIVIEDLNVSGMLTNRRLSRAVADLGFSEFRRQLEYKAEMAGSTVVVADRRFPSSKLWGRWWRSCEETSPFRGAWGLSAMPIQPVLKLEGRRRCRRRRSSRGGGRSLRSIQRWLQPRRRRPELNAALKHY